VPEPLRDASGRGSGRRGQERDDERTPGLAEEDGGEEAREEDDRDEGGAAAWIWWWVWWRWLSSGVGKRKRE
jgi:hypothetical protein